MDRTPSYDAWLRPTILVGAALVAAGLWIGDQLRSRGVVLAAAGIAAATLLAGPAAYAVTTVLHPASGPLAAAGPSTSSNGLGGPGGGPAGAAVSVDASLVSYLEAHRGSAKFLVAAFGSQSSASIIIATGQPVITIGGFNGSDPAPSLTQFERLVAEGQVRYVLVSSNAGFGGPGANTGSGASISQWVTANGKEVSTSNSGSGTLYDVSHAT